MSLYETKIHFDLHTYKDESEIECDLEQLIITIKEKLVNMNYHDPSTIYIECKNSFEVIG